MSFVLISSEKKKTLKSIFKKNDATISQALHFKRDSLTCRKIRSYSMNVLDGFYIDFV